MGTRAVPLMWRECSSHGEIKSQTSPGWTRAPWKPLTNFNGTVPCWVLRTSPAHTHAPNQDIYLQWSEGRIKKDVDACTHTYTKRTRGFLKSPFKVIVSKWSSCEWYHVKLCISRCFFFSQYNTEVMCEVFEPLNMIQNRQWSDFSDYAWECIHFLQMYVS